MLVFSPPPAEVLLEKGSMHCWLVDMPSYYSQVSQVEHVLSAEESARASRFVRPKDADNYRVSHSALRCILSRYVDLGPKDLIYNKSKYGKPSLEGGFPLSFNMSHSGDLALIAVSSVGQVGADIECGRENTEYMEIAERFFTQKECHWLEGVSGEGEKRESFLKLWACKESYIKATGRGMMEPLDAFDVIEVSSGRMQLQSAGGNIGWYLETGSLDWRERHYALAIASELPPSTRQNWMWTPLIGR